MRGPVLDGVQFALHRCLDRTASLMAQNDEKWRVQFSARHTACCTHGPQVK